MKLEAHVLPLVAAIAYALGGTCMKLSEGFRHPLPTFGLYALFLLGATLQTLALRRTDLGVSYVLVLGLEALVAFGIALFVFDETVAPIRATGVALILVGTFLLR